MERGCDGCPWKGKKFFKVMMDDYKAAVKLPTAFVLNHLKFNGSTERAILKDHSGKLWPVDLVKAINGSVLLSGEKWKEFVMGHKIEIGEFVIFQYYGNFNFMARVFHNGNCEKKVYVGESSRNAKPQDAFCTAINLKTGDSCVFELDEHRRFKVHFLHEG
ncbi:unnamed protein product [Victoria cruziana]